MKGAWSVARADFLERSRRFSFIAMMAISLFAVFWFVPRDDGSMQVMAIQPDRFVQAGNPSWIPIASAWGLGFFLPLIGFFYLKNSIIFDEKSGVSQLIASSPIGNIRYMLGKFCSGTLLLYCSAVVVVLGSFFMMIWHFSGQSLSAHSFLSPFLFLIFALPFCAAFAVFFESVQFLRGAIGSVIFVGAFFTMYIIASQVVAPHLLVRSFDLSGTSILYTRIANAVFEQSGRPMDSMMIMGSMEILNQPTSQLIFDGVSHTVADLQGFVGKVCITLILTLASAPLYRLIKEMPVIRLRHKHYTAQSVTESVSKPVTIYTPAQPLSGRGGLRRLGAELRLMLSGQPLFWYIISISGFASCLFIDLRIVQNYIIPLLMLWFLNIYSAMGSREYQHGILKIITTVPHGRLRQIVLSWLSGIIIALTIVVPVVLRMLSIGQIDGVLACLAGVVFAPSFSLFLGEYTKTRRAFELSFIVMTYFILNNVPAFMYIGTNPDIVSLKRAGIYLSAGVIMGVASVIKRVVDRTV